jgi:MraZ protein
MFFGEYNHNVDDKGRMSIPSKFREGLGGTFYVTKGLDNCLFVFPYDEWKKYEEKLSAIPISNTAGRQFVRFFYAGAIECSLDKQGRINISQMLRNHADIEKEVSIIGVGSRLEIWDKQAWLNANDSNTLNDLDIAAQMADLGI